MPSSVRPTRDSGLRIRIAPEDVVLRDWPLVDRPVGSLVAFALAAAMSGLMGRAAGSLGLGIAVALLLTLTLWKTWLPIRYELRGNGITQLVFGWRRRIPWTAIRHYEFRGDGVILMPDTLVSPLTPLRGLYLHWGDKQAQIRSHLDYYVQSWIDGGRASAVEPPLR